MIHDEKGVDSIYYVLAPLLIIVGVAQSSFISHIRIAGQHPDLIFAIVISWSLLRGIRQGLLVALIGGIVVDLLSGAPFGVFTVSLIGASVLSHLSAASFFRPPVLLVTIAAVSATFVYYHIGLALLYMGGYRVPWLDAFLYLMLPALPINLGMIFLVFPALRWLHRQTAQEEISW